MCPGIRVAAYQAPLEVTQPSDVLALVAEQVGLYREQHPFINKSVNRAGTETPVGAKARFVPTNNGLTARKASRGILMETRRVRDVGHRSPRWHRAG